MQARLHHRKQQKHPSPLPLPFLRAAGALLFLFVCLLPRLRSARRREQREKNSERPAQRKKREERINKREDSRQITTKWLIRERETTVVYTNNTQARNHQASASAVTKPGPCPCLRSPRSPLPLPLSKKKNKTLVGLEPKTHGIRNSSRLTLYHCATTTQMKLDKILSNTNTYIPPTETRKRGQMDT